MTTTRHYKVAFRSSQLVLSVSTLCYSTCGTAWSSEKMIPLLWVMQLPLFLITGSFGCMRCTWHPDALNLPIVLWRKFLLLAKDFRRNVPLIYQPFDFSRQSGLKNLQLHCNVSQTIKKVKSAYEPIGPSGKHRDKSRGRVQGVCNPSPTPLDDLPSSSYLLLKSVYVQSPVSYAIP